MRKLKNQSGFTLIEMLAVVLILVVLTMGMGQTMNAGVQIYRDAIFEADSATLAGILNNSLGDILRYSEDIVENPGTFEDSSGSLIDRAVVGFVFTNWDYGAEDAYFHIPVQAGGTSTGVLQMKSLSNTDIIELVNSGSYPDLVISGFKVEYVKETTGLHRNGYFVVSYDIYNENNTQLKRHVETVIRKMNNG